MPTRAGTRRPTRRAALAAAFLLGAVVGCGDDTPAEEASEPAPPEERISVETHFGPVELAGSPKRIVSLFGPYTDVAVALDADVVAMADFSMDGSLFPWLEGRITLGDSGAVNLGDPYTPIDVEKIAALDPDLILGSQYQVPDRAAYERLSAIAPTYVSVGATSSDDSWQLSTRTIGTLLGQPEAADELVEEVERQLDDVAARHPNIDGRTALYVGYASQGLFPVTGSDNPAVLLLESLGLVTPPQLADHPDQQVLSVENADQLDADVLFYILQDGTPLSSIPGWDQLRPVREGRAQELDVDAGVALIGPSVLNIPHLLDVVEPSLSALDGAT